MLCATILSSQIDCPILLTNKNKTNDNIINELNRLDTEVVYIIGGEDSISEKIVKTIHEEHIYTDRIHGKDRYETSIKIAEKINILKNTDSIILVNGKHSVADAISISPIAGNKNIPVIMCKKDDLETQKKWIKDNNINNIYIVGGTDVIDKNIEDYFYKEKIEVDRISGKDRYKTNAKVIKNFYTESKINKLFYCNGKTIDKTDEGIEAMLVVPLAVKEKSPIILLGEEFINEQRDAIKNKNIKSLVQVGNGVSEEAKAELYRLKDSYIPPQPPTNFDNENNGGSDENGTPDNEQGSSSEDESGGNDTSGGDISGDGDKDTEENGTTEETEPGEVFIYKETEISEDKKTITITFDKDISLKDEELNTLKENIKIIIDENNIVNNTSNEEKYIKLNKYDNVTINGKSLIIELEDVPIGVNSYISINTEFIKGDEINLIKDKDGNPIETLMTDSINGDDKKIAFVGNEDELIKYLSNKKTDIIKLKKDIDISKNKSISITKNIIINGSNGNNNFKIYNIAPQLKEFSMSRHRIIVKNLDIEGMYIYIPYNENKVVLSNMKIDLKNKKFKPQNSNEESIDKEAIHLYKAILECKDLTLLSNKSGIEVIEIENAEDMKGKVSTLIIGGYVYNEKADGFGNYKPSIILTNKIKNIGTDNINKIILKNECDNLEEIYEISLEYTNYNQTASNNTYINYYKPKALQPIQK